MTLDIQAQNTLEDPITLFEGVTTRYYINLMHPKHQRNIATREIRDQKDHLNFDDKVIRKDSIVECNKLGIVINELDSQTVEDYNAMIIDKARADKLELKNFKLEQELKELRAGQVAQVESVKTPEIKPVEVSSVNVIVEPDIAVVETEKVDSVPVNEDMPTTAIKAPKKARRPMKKGRTKKAK